MLNEIFENNSMTYGQRLDTLHCLGVPRFITRPVDWGCFSGLSEASTHLSDSEGHYSINYTYPNLVQCINERHLGRANWSNQCKSSGAYLQQHVFFYTFTALVVFLYLAWIKRNKV